MTGKREIFVFGSNLAGRHGKGAALFAKKNHGAIQGEGASIQGDSYAIPTKDENLKTMTLSEIQMFVSLFVLFALQNRHMHFRVTPIGTGLAGYTVDQIRPMFRGSPANVELVEEWWNK